MQRQITIAMFLLCMATHSLAEDACRTITHDLDRLACYDKASGRTLSLTKSEVVGAWVKEEETSKLTDDKNIYLYLDSNEGVNCGWNKGEKIKLIVRCMEKKTSLIFSTGCHMTSSSYDDYGKIDFRIDQQKAAKFTGNASTDNKSLGLWSGAKSIPIIKKMIGGSEMVVRMTPYGENPFTATFNVTGLDEAIKPVREQCKW